MRNSSKLLIAIGAVLVGLSAGKSAYAQEQSLSITGNGSDSVNTVSTTQNKATFVTQTNSSTVTNNVVINADTGHNGADSNTNGSSSVSTGSITSLVSVNNMIGTNKTAACCVSSTDPISMVVSGNGSSSSNSVNSSQSSTNALAQSNSNSVVNNVGGNLNTGANETSSNAGGTNKISTGDIFSHIGISSILNSNSATLGCCSITSSEPPAAGGTSVPSNPVAALLPNISQVLAASKVQILPDTGAGDTLWIMSLASTVLLFGFIIRRSAGSLLLELLSA